MREGIHGNFHIHCIACLLPLIGKENLSVRNFPVSKDKMDNIRELDAAQCLFGTWTSKFQIGISTQNDPHTPQSKWKL